MKKREEQNDIFKCMLLVTAFIYVYIILMHVCSVMFLNPTKTHVPTVENSQTNQVEIVEKQMNKLKTEEMKQTEEETIISERQYYENNKSQMSSEEIKNWFLNYKELCEISDTTKFKYLELPKTLYETFSEEELDKLFRVVEAEATAGRFIEKANVASVIFNRLGSELFGDSIDEILVPKQFSPLADGRWQKVVVSEDTVLGCEFAWLVGSTAEDALFFDATEGSWASRNKEQVFNVDDNLHQFYK